MAEVPASSRTPSQTPPQTPDDLLNNFKKQVREAKEEKARKAAEAEQTKKEAAERRERREFSEPPPFVAYFHQGGGKMSKEDASSEISDDFSFDDNLKLLSSLSKEELDSYHYILAHVEEDEKIVVADTLKKDDKLVYTLADHRKAVEFESFTTKFRAELSESARKAHDELVENYVDKDSEDEKAYVAYNEKLIAVTDILAMELEEKEGLQRVCDEQEDKDATAIEEFAKKVVGHYKDKTEGKKLAVVLSDPISTLNVYPDEYEVLPYALRDALLDAEAEVVMLDEEEEEDDKGAAVKDLQQKLSAQLENIVIE